jgi:hypothetical protein
MPWDYDADVQVTEADMYFLAAYHNMTIYYYKYGDMEKGRFFQLEVNPYFVHREQDDKSNVIDARWIDMQNGLYIDITAARYALDHPEGEGVLYDKFGHEYRVSESFCIRTRPLLITDLPCRIPTSSPCETRHLRECLARFPIVTRTCCKQNTGGVR